MIDKAKTPDVVEWALAWFALDNTMHQACHAAADANASRKAQVKGVNAEQEILQSVTSLLIEHRQWKERPIVKKAEVAERTFQNFSNLNSSEKKSILPSSTDINSLDCRTTPDVPKPATFQPKQFLNYPPLHIHNAFYCNLLNHYNSVELILSLVAKPMWEAPDRHRMKCAIAICRTHAAIGVRQDSVTLGRIWSFLLAGVAFGGSDACPVCPLSMSLI
jgi:hypothetical protein